MRWSDFWDRFLATLNYAPIEIGGTAISVVTLITFALVLTATMLVSWVVRRAVRNWLSRGGVADQGTIENGLRLIHYLIVLIGTGVALETVGFDLGALFAASAVLAIAVGFAMQNIAQNFVAGVILLIERTIKVGDILDVEGDVVRVTKMGIRATTARTREETELLIPNSTLVGSTVKNYTHQDSIFRVRVPVGVIYSTDLTVAMEKLHAAALELEWRMPSKEPLVLLTGFADSAIVLDVSVWAEDPWKSRMHYSELGLMIWRTLKANKITIAFPQLDVHFDPIIEQAVGKGKGEQDG